MGAVKLFHSCRNFCKSLEPLHFFPQNASLKDLEKCWWGTRWQLLLGIVVLLLHADFQIHPPLWTLSGPCFNSGGAKVMRHQWPDWWQCTCGRRQTHSARAWLGWGRGNGGAVCLWHWGRCEGGTWCGGEAESSVCFMYSEELLYHFEVPFMMRKCKKWPAEYFFS